ncbi:MAG: translocation/assembly module TamB domain-containing protein, partial [Acidobacteriia bacterium]|nr:translocation/assembly module TamB domain-containing protein [Terriglobia bacterium]
RPGIQGTVQGSAAGTIDLAPPPPGQRGFRIEDLRADIAARGLQLAGQALGDARLTAASEGRVLRAHLQSDFANSVVRGEGSWRMENDYPGSATVTFSQLDFGQLRAWIAPKSATPGFSGSAEGELRIDGPALRPEALKAELRIPKLELAPPPNALPANRTAPFTLRNSGPIVATVANSVVTIESARLQGRLTDVTFGGRALLNQKNALDFRVNGRIDLGILEDFNPDLSSSGTVVVNATVRGSLDDRQVTGRMEVQNAAVTLADFPNGLSNGNGVIVFTGDRATIQSLSGETGGGKVRFAGFAAYGGDQTIFRLHANAREVRVRYPEGVSTVADANLNLTGSSERSMLSGTITVLRTGFNPQSDFSSLLAKSAEPVRTPAARTGLLGGLNYDIQIQNAPDIQVQSSLAQDIEIQANLRLRGTVGSPALQGRINFVQGQLLFFGNKYNINQGSISFFNPVKIEPIVNIDLETKARGIDIIISIPPELPPVQGRMRRRRQLANGPRKRPSPWNSRLPRRSPLPTSRWSTAATPRW